MEKFLLIDANLLLYRSFFAALSISKDLNNMPTHLFFKTFLEIVKSEKPNYICFAFDAKRETKRQLEFDAYKAGRTKAPKELFEQREIIQEILDQMNLKRYEIIGDEADDIIATLCEKYKNDYEIMIFSEDKDLLQLVDFNVAIIQKNRKKNSLNRYKKINTNNFFQIYNFLPNQITDYKAIAGDNSDNIIGIKGIGHKSAIDLLSKYHSLENIYLHIDELSQKQKENFLKYKNEAFLFKKIATLNKNVYLDFSKESCLFEYKNISNEVVYNVLEKYNLKQISNLIKNTNF